MEPLIAVEDTTGAGATTGAGSGATAVVAVGTTVVAGATAVVVVDSTVVVGATTVVVVGSTVVVGAVVVSVVVGGHRTTPGGSTMPGGRLVVPGGKGKHDNVWAYKAGELDSTVRNAVAATYLLIFIINPLFKI